MAYAQYFYANTHNVITLYNCRYCYFVIHRPTNFFKMYIQRNDLFKENNLNIVDIEPRVVNGGQTKGSKVYLKRRKVRTRSLVFRLIFKSEILLFVRIV